MTVIFLVSPYIYILHYIIHIYIYACKSQAIFLPPAITNCAAFNGASGSCCTASSSFCRSSGGVWSNTPELPLQELWGMAIPSLGMPFAGHITSYPEWISHYVQNKTTIHPFFHGGMTLPFWWEHTSYFDHGTYKPVGAKGCWCSNDERYLMT